MSRELDILQGALLDEGLEMRLEELGRICGLEQGLIEELVLEGLLEPRGREPGDWRFSGPQICRLHRALRLRRHFELDWPGTALTLDLLDEIDRLRAEVRGLQARLK